MRKVRVSVPLILPDGLVRVLRSLRDRARGRPAAVIDLRGDRDIEWSWVAARIPPGPGRALDFGSGDSSLGLVAALAGYHVTAVDLGDVAWPYAHERLAFLRGDLLDLPLEEASLDLVLNCSAVEHVGIPGRYGVVEGRPDGDLAAMAKMRSLLRPGRPMLLTIPAGRDAVFPPWHRVYGPERLPRLLDGFAVESREYWLKDERNRWIASDEASVLRTPPERFRYGLGCFVLRRP